MLLYLTKRAVFTRLKVLARERYFIDAKCHENVFTQNISGIVTDHVKFYP